MERREGSGDGPEPQPGDGEPAVERDEGADGASGDPLRAGADGVLHAERDAVRVVGWKGRSRGSR